jgi:hypothetical protein
MPVPGSCPHERLVPFSPSDAMIAPELPRAPVRLPQPGAQRHRSPMNPHKPDALVTTLGRDPAAFEALQDMRRTLAEAAPETTAS